MENKLIHSIQILTEIPKQFNKVEIALNGNADQIKALGNPFNYKFIDIICVFKSSTGKEICIPAFWYQDYEIKLDTTWNGEIEASHGTANHNTDEPHGLETVDFKGEEHYRLRFLPEEEGTYTYLVLVNLNGELVQELSGEFTVIEELNHQNKGRIKVEKTNKRNFVFEDGSTFIPVGQNACWYTSQARKTYDYDVWFKQMSENEINATRIWMAPWGFSLHWGKKFDEFRLDAAARLDRVVTLAEEHDLYFLLTLINHGQFSAKVNPQWAYNPWNKANGGILDYPMEFFKSPEAKEIYKSQLKYIVARWGYSEHVLAWELWNEVSWVDDYLKSDDGYIWHEEMSKFVKEIDPYHHMVTTSFHNETNEANNIETIDFANPHTYGYTNKNFNTTLPVKLEQFYQMYHKPIFHSEIGINWQSGKSTGEEDPQGISLHHQNWAGVMGGGAGSAMNWWWDSFVHPLNLYYRFKGSAKFAKRMNMVSETYQQLRLIEEVKINHSQIGILGYLLDNRIYGYLYDHEWKYTNPEVESKTNITVELPFNNGEYTLSIFDTVSGDVLSIKTVIITNGKLVLHFEKITNDLAFIVE